MSVRTTARSRRTGFGGVDRLLYLALCLALCTSLLATVGCDRAEPPVGALSVAPRTLEIAFPEAEDLGLEWSPSRPLDGEAAPRVFIHVIDPGGELVRTFDHAFPEAWSPGESVSYSIPVYQSAIAPALPAGRYEVRVGLYGESGRRWPLDAVGGRSDEAYTVSELVVSDRVEEIPQFSFSASWLPEEVGRDRQVLARRWLAESGSIRIIGVREPGALWLRLAAPIAGLDNHALVVAGGAVPAVMVESRCSDVTEQRAAGDVIELRLPVAADCEIVVTPNYYWQAADTGSLRSVAIEGIAWIR